MEASRVLIIFFKICVTVFSLRLHLNIWIILKCGSCSLFMKSKQTVWRPCSSIVVCQLKANRNECRIVHNSLQGKHANLQGSPFKTNRNISSHKWRTKYAYPQQQIPKPSETLHGLYCISLSANKGVVPLKAIQSFSHCCCLSPARQAFW